MKKVLFTFLQFLLFLAVFAIGSFSHPFNLHWTSTSSSITQYPTGTVTRSHIVHYFVPDGLLLAVGVLLAIVVIQLIRKRPSNSVWTVLAFALAVAAGYAMRFGYVTMDLY
jgi:hypothetical protein